MNKDDKQILKVAIGFTISILSYGEPTLEAIKEILKIKSGDKETILSHLKAINNITSDAIKILEKIIINKKSMCCNEAKYE